MNASDHWLRRRAHRNRRLMAEREPKEPKRVPLVSQGARIGGYPRPQLTPDELIRRAVRRSSGPVGWVRIF